jgi:hypothetical protein
MSITAERDNGFRLSKLAERHSKQYALKAVVAIGDGNESLGARRSEEDDGAVMAVEGWRTGGVESGGRLPETKADRAGGKPAPGASNPERDKQGDLFT